MPNPQFYRIGSLIDLGIAKTKKIAFFGGGSLGSFVFADLAPYDWGKVIIADMQTLEEANRERHLLGDHPEELGKYKAEALERYLLRLGKNTPGTIVSYNGPAQDIFSQCEDASLLVVSIDNQAALEDINLFAVKHTIPVIYGGVFPKGISGMVVTVSNPRNVCYRCFQHQMGFDLGGINTGTNYGLDITKRAQDEPKEVPALRANVSAVAADMAIYAKRLLMGEKVEPQVMFDIFDWDSVLTFDHWHPSLEPIMHFVSSMKEIGFVQNQRLHHKEGGKLDYQLNMSKVSISLTRWGDCPMHGVDGVSIDEI